MQVTWLILISALLFLITIGHIESISSTFSGWYLDNIVMKTALNHFSTCILPKQRRFLSQWFYNLFYSFYFIFFLILFSNLITLLLRVHYLILSSALVWTGRFYINWKVGYTTFLTTRLVFLCCFKYFSPKVPPETIAFVQLMLQSFHSPDFTAFLASYCPDLRCEVQLSMKMFKGFPTLHKVWE